MADVKSNHGPDSSQAVVSDDLRSEWERPTLVRLMATNAMGDNDDQGGPEGGDSDS